MLAEPVRLHPSLRLKRTSTFSLGFDRFAAMDLTTIDHGNGDRLHTKAIYVLHGDELTYCVAPPGQARPTAFTTRSADGLTLVTLKRLR
jgi:uncharacterized protein (TIGR03067 family)